ncbi:hypothetical protein [Xanthomonas sp. 3075]|uniref:hypothetical protein n=1 Tax=Xanthomonas sp. 3075 TaxID=3035315 RepID=UPI00185B4DC9|nr:hypothetical protein [Xanthomonas sp. 3075]MBB4131867.1 hypothetical protein [Xanthomonas sp. 3075]
MSTRSHTDHQLSDLDKMLGVWPQRVRDPSQFWPQFDALAQGILDAAARTDVARVRRQLRHLLRCHGLTRTPTPCRSRIAAAPRLRHGVSRTV